MKFCYCCVPGCRSKARRSTTKLGFFNLPISKKSEAPNPLKRKRRQEWIKAIQASQYPKSLLDKLTVCSKHFVTGRPSRVDAIYHTDWIPSRNMPKVVLQKLHKSQIVQKIINNLPEVVVKFDEPEYIFLDMVKFNEKQIEMDLIQKYLTTPVCDENGYYNNDHDYLGLPVVPTKTDTLRKDLNNEHSYSLTHRPACLHFDSRHFCNICACNCFNLFSFNTHMRVHTFRNDVVCSICLQRLMTSTCLNTHLSTHRVLCDVCGNEVPAVQLQAHQWVNRNQKYQIDEISMYNVPVSKKIYFCVFCVRKFSNFKEYSTHRFMHKKKVRKTKGA